LIFVSLDVLASQNENIVFLQQIHEQAKTYDQADLEKWNMGEGADAIVPESADAEKLEHVRILVAANPDRYEGYVMYGLHFFLKGEFDVAVTSYEKATAIILRDGIENPVNYKKYYSMSLIMIYQKTRNSNKAEALKSFDKLMEYDFDIFNRDP
jgi:tetratricopeptide (TPR) repeat protein